MSFNESHRKVADGMVAIISKRDADSTITKLDIENYGRFLDAWNLRHAIETTITPIKKQPNTIV